MKSLTQKMQKYHISIRKSIRTKETNQMRIRYQMMLRDINNQKKINKFLEDFKNQNENPQQLSQKQIQAVIEFLEQLKSVSVQSLNNQLLLNFLVYLLQFSNSKNPQFQIVFEQARQILYNFTLNSQSIILKNIFILEQVLIKSEMICLYENITTIQQWNQTEKSNVLNLLCQCIHQGLQNGNYLDQKFTKKAIKNLKNLITNNVIVFESVLIQTLNIFQLIVIKSKERYQDDIIQQVLTCINSILKLYTHNTEVLFNHQLFNHITEYFKRCYFFSASLGLTTTAITTISLLIIQQDSKQFTFDFSAHIPYIIHKGIRTGQKQTFQSIISVIKLLFMQGKCQYLKQHKILNKLVDLIMKQSPSWKIRVLSYEIIVWMMLNAKNKKTLNVLESVGCLDVIELGINQQLSNEIIYSILKLIMVMVINPDQLYEDILEKLVNQKNLKYLLYKKENHQGRKISELATKVLQTIDQIGIDELYT